MDKLTAKDLKRRYRAGERNFAGVDLSGESLRGMNLKGIDLSGADLSRTDIRGTNFSEANLANTQFVAAKAGTQRRWLVSQLLIAFALTAVASFLVGTLWTDFASSIVSPLGNATSTVTGGVIYGVVGIGISLGFLGVIYTRGVLVALGVALGAFAFSFAGASAVAFAGANAVAIAGASAVAFAGAVAIAIAIAIDIAVAIAGASAVVFVFTVAFAVTGNAPVVIAITAVGILANIIISFLIARRALLGDSRDSFVRNISVWFVSWGGTKFVKANLTDASFQSAILKSAHLYQADLTRTNFHLSKKVNLSRLGKIILANFQVQNLLINLRSSGQAYAGLNLKGAYLADADLADTDFTEADLSNATLEGATLERANLTKTQALGTNFRRTILTGATLEAWNIDDKTELSKPGTKTEWTVCDYVYLLRNHQERRPSSGTFAPGEFAKLFQEVLNTIDLIFRDGVDWKAFIQTLNQVQVEHGDVQLAIQAIENKGDGVVIVKLQTAPNADKKALHHSFMQGYQKAFKAAEKKYKDQLHFQDREIQIYHQKSAELYEIVKLQAQRPINVQANANAGDNAMQVNDNSRNISIGGNATGNVFQTGDGNTASIEFQQVTLPPPDRVNIQAELAALQTILAGLNDPVTTGIAAKLDAEAAKPAPDKSVVATTLETGLTYARNLQGFAEAIDKLRPHVQNAAGWLGEHGTKLLPLVGLVL